MARLAPGLLVFACVAGCTALAWPGDSPIVPQAGGALVGRAGWAWAFLGLLALAFVAYLAGLHRIARGGVPVPLRWVVVLALAVQLVPLGAPLMLSSDAWTYWMYGRIAAVHDANPYEDPPSAFPDDPAYEWAGERWRDSTSVYAPGFTLASEPIALAAGESHNAAAWLYKALAALAACATVLLAARFASRPALAAAFVGWNPLLAVHLAGGGHNDAWVGALLLAALATQAKGVAWAFGAAVKWIPLVLLPLQALATRRRAGLGGFVVATSAIVALATWRYGFAWVDAFGPLADNARETTSYALPRRLSQLGVPEDAAIALFALLFAVVYLVLARAAWRGRARLALASVALLACAPYVTPWYLAWVVPLAAVEEDRLARGLALAFTAYLLPQTIPV